MRLLFLVSSLPFRKIGGTEIMTLRICEHLAREGEHEPFIHTIARSNEERTDRALQELFERYDVTHLKKENISFSSRTNDDSFLSYTRANRSYAKGLKHIVQRIGPDLVVSMKVMPPETTCTRLSSVLRGSHIPYILMVRGFTDLHNVPIAEGFSSGRSLPGRIMDSRYFRKQLPAYIKWASGIIAQTSSQQEFLWTKYKVVSTPIPNPIDHEMIARAIDEGGEGGLELRNKKKIDEASPTLDLVYVGSLIPRKDVATLLKALKILGQKDQENVNSENANGSKPSQVRFRLHLVGGGRGEERIKELISALGIEDIVDLKGKLPPTELWPFLSSCDMFVFPSLSEGFPNALLEAMACGLPIISSDFAGVRDVIRTEENGRVFKRGDAKALATSIRSLAEDPSLNDIGKFNQQFVRQFTWDAFMQRFEEVLNSIAGINRSGP